jgi:hypothetical protein
MSSQQGTFEKHWIPKRFFSFFQEALQRAFDAKTAYFVNNIAELSLETQASTNTIVYNDKF